MVHKLLKRQLGKVFGDEAEIPEELVQFLDVVDSAYHQADLDRVLLERSLDLTSIELLEANRELRAYATDLERRVAERTAELRSTNESLELEAAERAAAERAIGISEERYRSLFEGSKDAIYISTPDGKLIDVNPAAVELFGYDSVDDLLAVDVARDIYREPEHRHAFLERVNREGYVRDGDLEVVRKDGEVLHVLDTTTAVVDQRGEVVAYRGIIRDVTSQRRLERELLQVQKMEAVGRLAGGVAHDFNNLLTAIHAYAERLVVSLDEFDDRRAFVDAIADAAERGSALTTRLLAFGRRQVLRPACVDLNLVIDEMRGLIRQMVPEDVELSLELAPDVDPVWADRTQLEQVILNLVMNAGDAMESGGRLTIRTARCRVGKLGIAEAPALEAGSYTHLAVEDTGVGINDAVRDHIFEPFFTTKSSAKGTGLGLATVYSAVHDAGGLVEVRSEMGSGTCFDIYLPADEGVPEAAEPETVGRAETRGDERVLLVEDDPAVRSVLTEYLESQGYSVVSAEDGREGLATARREGSTVDLVLSDVVMPKMNGVELARVLREELPGVRVLLISGHADDRKRVVEESLEWPACTFLQKPFTPYVLATKIRELLDA
jgi:PAS domain S-box-containing protein